ncbi:MAG: hypothetical protein V2I37_08050 [Marinilabiliaceae bacterium]|jgi:ribosomal protein S18 acetylase RimI-like enzyme|nr:hypothetical protein [Marinilabiliaceae bacterium]
MKKPVIKAVKSKKDLKTFIHLPERIHKNFKNWMPPLFSDEWVLLDPAKNRAFGHCDYIQLLAFNDSKPVGRIMGLINHKYNEKNKLKTARFCFLECYNDHVVSNALISYVENWAREKGMNKIIGPFAFSDKDPQGCQISGFDTPGVIAAPNNNDYLSGLIEREGYEKEEDLVEYKADIPDKLPDVYLKIMDRASTREKVDIIEFRTKRELKPWIIPILELLNETFKNIYGFVPLTDREKKDFARRYLPILDPAFIKAAKINNELVGFVISMPDISSGMLKARGRLFPFGFIHILRAVKKSNDLLMLLGGVKEEYRGRGVDAIMGSKILESASKSRMKTIDSHLVLEKNKQMRAEYERIDAKIIKTFRIYRKAL